MGDDDLTQLLQLLQEAARLQPFEQAIIANALRRFGHLSATQEEALKVWEEARRG